MNSPKSLKLMWLLNHTTLRQFEIEQLNNLGVKQIFTPKMFPYDEGNLSASVTYEFDGTLDISQSELDQLNSQDWYGEPSSVAWEIANRYFDVIVVGFFPRQLLSACRNFKGAIILRAFGLGGEETYSKLIRQIGGPPLQSAIAKASKRFWFGIGYDHLSNVEDAFIADRAVFMPVGLKNATFSDQWKGEDRHIFFVCPRIGSSPYFKRIYKNFIEAFKGLPYFIGGAQPIRVNDPHILGFVDNDQYKQLMQQSRVMFYHSREPNLIHYHPFEAIRAGMPLIFMAGGMLDRMGGKTLLGRCVTVAEARRKIDRILNDDWALIEKIRASQAVLLAPMKAENCEPAWREGFKRITDELDTWRKQQVLRPRAFKRKRVAIILPVGYHGGSLRGALALAKALYSGSRQYHEDADVVFLHLDDPKIYDEEVFADFPETIVRRPFSWKILSASESRRAMRYAGFDGWEPSAEQYIVPDDGMQQLVDCDLWLFVSDRFSYPVLPIKPIVLMVYDYLQRYVDILSHGADMPFLQAARSAERVLVTTEFTRQDALQYSGVEAHKVKKMPMLAPEFPIKLDHPTMQNGERPYFLWTTNPSSHKNHKNTADALQIYYETLAGELDCNVTGFETKGMLARGLPHLLAMAEVFERSKILRKRVKWLGELPDAQYQHVLSQSRFLMHAGRIDNGTFSVIEAACLGVPSLSSNYPPMREIDEQFSLNLSWMNPDSPRDMAEQLKIMELNAMERRKFLPSEAELKAQRIECHASAYWQEVRQCL